MHLPSLVAALLALPAAAQLDVRPPAPLAGPGSGYQHAVATDQDLSVALVSDGVQLELHTSDGRGVSWSGPLNVSPVAAGTNVSNGRTAVSNDRAFVAWADTRFKDPSLAGFISFVPFVRVFDGQAGVLGPEAALPIASAPATTRAQELALAVEGMAGITRVYVASIEDVLDPLTSLTERRVVLYTSIDGGATWPSRVVVTSTPEEGIADLRLEASGGDVHIFWTRPQSFPGYSVRHARSVDGGATVSAPTTIPGAQANFRYDVDVEGSLVALAWENYDFNLVSRWVKTATSQDKGATWGVPQFVQGDGSQFAGQSQHPAVVIRPGTAEVTVLAVAYHSSLPGPSVMRLHSDDGGSTWLPKTVLGSGPVSDPRLAVAGDGRARMVASWIIGSTGFFRTVRVSLDGGVSFEPGTADLGTANHSGTGVWNDHYQNYLVPQMAATGPNAGFVGGLRPQDIDLTGFTGGSTSLNIDFANMTGGADLALFVVSSAEGALALPAPDGRITGLGASPLLNATLGLATSGVFLAPLSSGAGTTGPIPTLPLQPGLTAYGLGLSIDLATGAFVDLTDVMRIDT